MPHARSWGRLGLFNGCLLFISSPCLKRMTLQRLSGSCRNWGCCAMRKEQEPNFCLQLVPLLLLNSRNLRPLARSNGDGPWSPGTSATGLSLCNCIVPFPFPGQKRIFVVTCLRQVLFVTTVGGIFVLFTVTLLFLTD